MQKTGYFVWIVLLLVMSFGLSNIIVSKASNTDNSTSTITKTLTFSKESKKSYSEFELSFELPVNVTKRTKFTINLTITPIYFHEHTWGASVFEDTYTVIQTSLESIKVSKTCLDEDEVALDNQKANSETKHYDTLVFDFDKTTETLSPRKKIIQLDVAAPDRGSLLLLDFTFQATLQQQKNEEAPNDIPCDPASVKIQEHLIKLEENSDAPFTSYPLIITSLIALVVIWKRRKR